MREQANSKVWSKDQLLSLPIGEEIIQEKPHFVKPKTNERQVRVVEDLKSIPTCELVEELKRREGVETTIAEPYEDITVTANGPAIILKIID